MGHEKLTISIDLAVTANEVATKPYQIESPDSAKLSKVDSIVQVFDKFITFVKVLQPILERSRVIYAVKIPSLDRLEIPVMPWHLVKAPKTTMRKNILVGENTGNVIRQTNGDDVKKERAIRLKAGGQFLEGVCQVSHMAKDTHRKDLVELFVKLDIIEVALNQSEPLGTKIAFRVLHLATHVFALFMA